MSKVSNDATGGDLLQFEWSVRALAQEVQQQHTLFPPFVCLADELALEFDECRRRVSELTSAFNDEQAAALRALDQRLEEMSAPDNAGLWTDEALAQSAEWQEVRRLSRELLDRMGWPRTPPPSVCAMYIGPDA